MANFSDLPTEIWLLIAQYLSVLHLAKIKSLNSLFFNCYMDMRWERLEVREPSWVIRDLQRMIDPFVATRTKLLTLYLDYLSESVVPNLVTSLALLPNITSLNIIEKFTNHFVLLFPAITSSSILRTLRKLQLIVRLDLDVRGQLAEHSAPNTSFKNLTVLFLDIDSSSFSQKELPPLPSSFLRTLAPTIQQLRISDQPMYHDLSPLFSTLCKFPCLTTLILVFRFRKAEYLQTSQQSLLRFLVAHENNLQHLHLKFGVSRYKPDEEHLGVWLTELANNSRFSSLQTLEIGTSNTPAGLSAVLALIQHSAPTLTSLAIYESYLTHEDAARVLDTLTESGVQGHIAETTPRNYKNLEIGLFRLSVPFIDLLARKIPQLENLSLYVHEYVDSDQLSFLNLLQHRHYNPDTPFTQDILHSWKLQNLSIHSGPRSFPLPHEDAVRAIAGAVPALARRMPR